MSISHIGPEWLHGLYLPYNFHLPGTAESDTMGGMTLADYYRELQGIMAVSSKKKKASRPRGKQNKPFAGHGPIGSHGGRFHQLSLFLSV